MDNLRQRIKDTGLTINEFARRAELGEYTVRRIMKGQRVASYEQKERINEILSIFEKIEENDYFSCPNCGGKIEILMSLRGSASIKRSKDNKPFIVFKDIEVNHIEDEGASLMCMNKLCDFEMCEDDIYCESMSEADKNKFWDLATKNLKNLEVRQ